MATGYSDAEQKINLSVLQQKDPYITGIADSASQVAAYSFNATLNEWVKTNIEGTLFVYTRSAFPLNGFMIINRLHLNDLIEPINKNLEFQLQDPFLLYRNSKSAIFGIWFYDRDECARIGQLMNSLVQVATDTQNQEVGRQRRASESDSTSERPLVSVDTAMCSISPQKNNVDIIQMLSKAQDEYDKGAAACPSPTKRVNGTSPSLKHCTLYNGMVSGQGLPGLADQQPNATTHINLETLFMNASMQDGKQAIDQRFMNSDVKGSFPVQPPVLLPSQTTPMVEEIERAQRESNAGNMGVPLGIGNDIKGGPFRSNRHLDYHCQQLQSNPQAPESPNTALRRTLKIVPPASSSVSSCPSSVVAHAVGRPLKQSDPMPECSTSKPQSTVVRALFSQQSGRLSGHGGLPRPISPAVITSTTITPYCLPMQSHQTPGHAVVQWLTKNNPKYPNSSLPCSVAPLLGAPKYVHATVQQSKQPWSRLDEPSSAITSERKPAASTSVAAAPSTINEIFTRQSSVCDILTKPEAFLSNIVKNNEILGNIANTTMLLSPMAFQNLGTSSKLQKGNPNITGTITAQCGPQEFPHPTWPNDAKEQSTPNRSPYKLSSTAEPEPRPVTPLNKEQLRQALVNLLMTDNDFITSIHEAYTACINKSLGQDLNH